MFDALMQQNPLQLEEVLKPAPSQEEAREATRRSIKELEKQEGKRGSKRGKQDNVIDVDMESECTGAGKSGGKFGAPIEGAKPQQSKPAGLFQDAETEGIKGKQGMHGQRTRMTNPRLPQKKTWGGVRTLQKQGRKLKRKMKPNAKRT